MSDYVSIPVATAERVANDYEKDQLIIIAYDKKHNKVHFTTYGKTASEKLDSARSINMMKKHYFGIEVSDGDEAPIGFEDFEWSNEENDFVEKI